VEIKQVGADTVRVDLRVFGADGANGGAVDTAIIAWSFSAYEATVARIEADGWDVVRGTPEIGDDF
jgi:hypothetical protein